MQLKSININVSINMNNFRTSGMHLIVHTSHCRLRHRSFAGQALWTPESGRKFHRSMVFKVRREEVWAVKIEDRSPGPVDAGRGISPVRRNLDVDYSKWSLTYRKPARSCFCSVCSTSISIMAASLYFCTFRITFMATY